MLINIPVPDWWPKGTTRLEYDVTREAFREHRADPCGLGHVEETTLEAVKQIKPADDIQRRILDYLLRFAPTLVHTTVGASIAPNTMAADYGVGLVKSYVEQGTAIDPVLTPKSKALLLL